MNGSSTTWLKGSGIAFSAALIAGGLLARSGGIRSPRTGSSPRWRSEG